MLVHTNVVAEVHDYLQGVLGRADHHAPNVDEVVVTLMGAIIAFAEPDSIELLAQDGEIKNALWARIRGQRYAFSYDHTGRRITAKRGGNRGPVVAAFDNSATARQVIATFRGL
jgi:hypothetical protein